MRRMTRYEHGQWIVTIVTLVFPGPFVVGVFRNGPFGVWQALALFTYASSQLVFQLAVAQNWRDMVDEQITREQHQAMANGRSYLPGTAERRRRSLQRVSMLMTITSGLLLSFAVVFVILDRGRWLG